MLHINYINNATWNGPEDQTVKYKRVWVCDPNMLYTFSANAASELVH